MRKLIRLATTFFGIGYLPGMPGTYASVCGALVFVVLHAHRAAYWWVTGVVTLAGFALCGRGEAVFGKKDPSQIVIDEVSGMLLCCAFVPFSWKALAAAFVLFRVFDVVKPFPLFQIQRVKGGAGIMLDDIGAAAYTALLLRFAAGLGWLQ